MEKNSTLKSSLKSFLSNLWDLILVNILWIVCSLPVITMGPATCAAYSVMLKTVDDETVPTAREFFRAFKDNFVKGLLLGLIGLGMMLLIAADLWFAVNTGGDMGTGYFIISGILGVLFFIYIVYVFPLQARFDNTIGGHIKNAFKLAVIAPGKTLLMILIYALLPLSILVLPRVAVYYLGWFYLLFMVSLPVFMNSRILMKIFSSLTGEKKDES